MKQDHYRLILFLLVALFTSCDSQYHGRVHIQNFSSKAVTFHYSQMDDQSISSIEIPANKSVEVTEFHTNGNIPDAPEIQTFLTEMSIDPVDSNLLITKDINLSVNWSKLYQKIRGKSGEEWNYIYYISDADIE